MKVTGANDRLPTICFVLAAKDLGYTLIWRPSPLSPFVDFIGSTNYSCYRRADGTRD